MIQRRLTQLKDESGFALVSVLILMMVGTLFALAAWSSSKADITPTAKDRESKQAYAAAEAGINYYLFRLGQNNAYWTDCDQVAAPNSSELNPVNLEGATTLRWRNVPSTTNQYAIELIAQNGVTATGTWCTPGATAASSLLDSASGTMQIRSTGKVGNVRRSVVATLRRSGFLDYLYFTDYETQDPQVTGSSQACNVYRRDGRSSSCSTIVFASDDAVNGPFHTNDDIVVCGTPDFGRTVADQIEVQAPTNGWASGCGGGASPNFKGTYKEDAKHLDMPASNTALKDVALPTYLFTGTTQITLNNGTMDVTNASLNGGATTNLPWPSNGVVYVQNGASCTTPYSAPQTYTEPASCGNVYVKGTYQKSLTIGAQRDIIVTNSITKNGNYLLGLVANTFVRIYHPVNTSSGCSNASSGPFGSAPGSVTIDAAMLSVGHSFIVDNYNCGSPLGTLTVNGAIAQTYRGPVGTGGSSISTGYVKNYNYDDRFKVANPPYFLDPVQSSWRTVRYTEQFPARQGG